MGLDGLCNPSQNRFMSVSDVLQRLASNWATRRPATLNGEPTVAQFHCRLDGTAVAPPAGISAPPDLEEFWQTTERAVLFEDEYGDWGLCLWGPDEALKKSEELRAQREDLRTGDLVFGRVLGEQTQVVMRCDPDDLDFGSVVMGRPDEPRNTWHTVTHDLGEFLSRYEAAQGTKIWEPGHHEHFNASAEVASAPRQVMISLSPSEALVLRAWLAEARAGSFGGGGSAEEAVVAKVTARLEENAPEAAELEEALMAARAEVSARAPS